MRVLICGDRNWDDRGAIAEQIRLHPEVSTVIEGEAKGADSLARDVAESLGLEVLKFPANWKRFGRAAGPIRNKQMLVEGCPDEVWAFHRNLRKSRGTLNMIKAARKAGVCVRIFPNNPPPPANN